MRNVTIVACSFVQFVGIGMGAIAWVDTYGWPTLVTMLIAGFISGMILTKELSDA